MIIKIMIGGFIFLLGTCNIYAMNSQGPHRNLERTAANICWMNAALQCLAANDDFIGGLEIASKNGKLVPLSWQLELLNVLKEVRDVGQNQKVNPQKLYNVVINNPDFGDIKCGAASDSRDFIQNLYIHLFGNIGLGYTKNVPLKELRDKFMIKIITTSLDGTKIKIDVYQTSGTTGPWTENFNKGQITQQFFFSDYFYYDLGNSGKGEGIIGWDDLAQRGEWTDIETIQTVDTKKGKLSCYAILCGASGHANALIKDKKNDQWYDYNDLMNNTHGVPVEKALIDKAVHSGKFQSGAWNQKIMLMFYQNIVIEQDPPILTSLRALKIKLDELKKKLLNLSLKLIQLKKNLSTT